MINNVSDIVEDNGKTVKQNNLDQKHSIPLGSLVEVSIDYIDEHGIRLFVVGHLRDCDGTPLYELSFDKNWEYEPRTPTNDPLMLWARGYHEGKATGGYSEASLIWIKPHSTRK